MSSFKKILIANRGEIAIRVMRAANEMGKRTVAVFAEEDKLSLHRFKSDEAYRIGEGLGPVAAYLKIPEIIRVAKMAGADAIHPGYGLLSENPALVDACDAAGISFIGPRAETMRELGDKASARKVAIAAGVPVIPATEVLPDDMAEVRRMADGGCLPHHGHAPGRTRRNDLHEAGLARRRRDTGRHRLHQRPRHQHQRQ
jgi:pyruvate carboxylase